MCVEQTDKVFSIILILSSHICVGGEESKNGKFSGQRPGPGPLANVQGQKLWSKSRARYSCQCLGPGNLTNVQGKEIWPMSRVRNFG